MSITWIFSSLPSQKLVRSVNISHNASKAKFDYYKHHGTSHYYTPISQTGISGSTVGDNDEDSFTELGVF